MEQQQSPQPVSLETAAEGDVANANLKSKTSLDSRRHNLVENHLIKFNKIPKEINAIKYREILFLWGLLKAIT